LNLKQSSVHDEIINRGQGSAQPNISGGAIETLKVVIAPDVVISNFNVMLYPSFKKMISNQQESLRLAELRDTLLPKLMSGELKVNEVAA
jgi:type I restriction enzyme S subunit